MKLHIYTTGRFGPEKHIGFVITDNVKCIQETSNVTFDIVKAEAEINERFWTNPLSISNINRYRNWKNKVLAKG